MNAVRDFERMRNAAYPTRTSLTDAYAEGYDDGTEETREKMLRWYGARLAQVAVLSAVFGAGLGAVLSLAVRAQA